MLCLQTVCNNIEAADCWKVSEKRWYSPCTAPRTTLLAHGHQDLRVHLPDLHWHTEPLHRHMRLNQKRQ